MPVALYLRVSTEEQRERQSIATQREFGTKYCDLHNLSIYQIYADDGVSGTVALELRPAGGRLFEDARRRKFDQVLVYKLDRLGRDARLILNSVDGLEKCGVRVRSGTEEFDTGTASGRLMLTMLSGFAAHEREVIKERSVAGTNRLAEAGAWLGGIVPYGYRKQGERREARIVLNLDQIPGFGMSEVDVVRSIFHMSGVERKSCQKIADHLNCLGIPAGSVLQSEGGKRNRRTAPVWRPSHIRNLLISRTYRGEHCFGKRSKNPKRVIIVRPVPPIVPVETWEVAQQVLRSNLIMSRRNVRQPYLLRGLIKCGLCGLTYSGMRMTEPQKDHYYRCNGRQFARGLYGAAGKRCPGKSINGDYVERLVWADIESFLRNPEEILGRLRERLCMQDVERERLQSQLNSLRVQIDEKTTERDRVLTLFRRGRIDEEVLDQQLHEIEKESVSLQRQFETGTTTLAASDRTEQLNSAEALLETLRTRLDGTISPDMKRRLFEILVEKVEANTVERWNVPQSEVTIFYRFTQPTEPAALVLPRTHRINARHEKLADPKTLGDHLRLRRLSLKLLQRQVAAQFGINVASIYNWENNRGEPELRYIPAILTFLGYNPFPAPTSTGDRLISARTAAGISQREAARQIGVDQSTLARWERGEREPAGIFADRAFGLCVALLPEQKVQQFRAIETEEEVLSHTRG
jgi:site-specific DNA recombinase